MTMLTRLKEAHEQASKLVEQMSLAQKIGQMTLVDRSVCTPEDVKNYHLGAVFSAAGSTPQDNSPRAWVEMNDAFWRASTDTSDGGLGIPILYGLDAVHGNSNVQGATIFPHNIGLGATHDVDLIEQVAKTTAKEVLACGLDWVFSPVLAVAQDTCWGRSYESFSEDPKLVSHYAKAMVKGLQEQSVIACAKHWVGDGGTNHGIDQGNAEMSEDELNNVHVRPYIDAIEAGVMTVMASFNSWNGEKCHANHYLLTKLLKQRLGFLGFVVSDMQGIDHVADDYYVSVEKSVNAGIDMFMVPKNWKQFIDYTERHVEMGSISASRIDDAVRRILAVKLASGLFDKPQPSQRLYANDASFGGEAHRELARQAVQKSCVLLKNQNNVIPLSKSKRIFVTGKSANNIGNQCGGFTLEWQGVSGNHQFPGACSIWQGIQKYAPNAQLCADGSGKQADPQLHDVAVVIIGETPYAEGAGDIREGDKMLIQAGSQIDGQVNLLAPLGSSQALSQLHPEDLACIRQIAEKGIPIVVIMLTGRPLVVDFELGLSDAFVVAWLPGSEGQGVADLLFAEQDFDAKLAFTWPSLKSAEQARKGEVSKPMFKRGYGLRYRSSLAKRWARRLG